VTPVSHPRVQETSSAGPTDPQIDTVAAYEAIAGEYDQPWHRTTRELERLSALALRSAPLDGVLSRPNPLVVELGCGTGAFSVELVKRMSGGQILLSDPAEGMLRRAMNRLAATDAGVANIALRAPAASVLSQLVSPPALIAAGLADPFLSQPLLRTALRAADPETRVVVTVPTHRWAMVERGKRLGIPIDQTRFRTVTGGAVRSRSLSLDANDLVELFASSGFAVIAHGTITADPGEWSPAPEVAWTIGRPIIAAAPARQ
jgi:precorrin-6B methylase 2